MSRAISTGLRLRQASVLKNMGYPFLLVTYLNRSQTKELYRRRPPLLRSQQPLIPITFNHLHNIVVQVVLHGFSIGAAVVVKRMVCLLPLSIFHVYQAISY